MKYSMPFVLTILVVCLIVYADHQTPGKQQSSTPTKPALKWVVIPDTAKSLPPSKQLPSITAESTVPQSSKPLKIAVAQQSDPTTEQQETGVWDLRDRIRKQIEAITAQREKIRSVGGEVRELDTLLIELQNYLTRIQAERRGHSSLDQGSESCSSLVTISYLPFSDEGVLGNTDDCNDRPYQDLFYRFTAPVAGSFTADMCGSQGDTYLRIWLDGVCCSGSSITADDECGNLAPSITFSLSCGQTVYFECGNYYTGGSSTSYSFHLSTSANIPSCNTCTADGYLTFTTNPWESYYSATVCQAGRWMGQFQTTAGFLYHFDLCPDTPGSGFADFDIDIKICDASCNILSGEDGSCSSGLWRPNNFMWTAPYSGTFYVVLAPYLSYNQHSCTGTAGQNFTLNYYSECQPQPVNDLCQSVTPVSLPATFTGTTTCATNDCPTFAGGNVWIAFYIDQTCDLILDFCSSPGTYGNVWLNLAYGCPCTGFSPDGAFENTTCTDSRTTIRWTGVAAGTYYYPVLLDPALGSVGPYVIHVGCAPPPPPPNDNCANAIPLVVNNPTPTGGTTVEATQDCPLTGSPEVWYTFTLDECSNVQVQYCGYNTGAMVPVQLFSGSCCGTVHSYSRWETNTCPDGRPTVYYDDMVAGTYWLPVFFYSGTPFFVKVTATPGVPANDQCANATLLSVPAQVYENTACATLDNTTSCPWPPTAPGIWYKVTGSGNSYTATTCGPATQFDTKLSIFTCGPSNLSCVGENDDSICTYNPVASSLSWCTRAGEMYWILVHGYQTTSGPFMLRVTDSGIPCFDPARCPCWDYVMNFPTDTIVGTTVGQDNDCSQFYGNDVIVKSYIPQAGNWLVTSCGSAINIAFYPGTDCCSYGELDYASWTGCAGNPADTITNNYCWEIPQAGIYYWTIKAGYGDGPFRFYTEGLVTGTPAQVTGVSATQTDCDGITVTWTDLEGESFYLVERDSIGLDRVVRNGTHYTDSPSIGTHSYRVKAFSCSSGPWSLPAVGILPPLVADTPTLGSPINGSSVLSGSPQLYSWNNVPNANMYSLWLDDDPAFNSPVTSQTPSPNYVATLSNPLGTWYWKVRGENGCGFGPWSGVRTIELILLSPPVLVTRRNGALLQLYWNRVPFATSYDVQSSNNSETGFTDLTTTTDTTITTSFSAQDKLFYRVIAIRN